MIFEFARVAAFFGRSVPILLKYHLAQNKHSFDALQAYCFRINIKL